MNECRIIEDLLPLYTDGLLQEDTTEFVKMHLVRCAACSEKEKQLRAIVDVPPPAPKTDKKSRFRRVSRKAVLKTFFISAACCVLAVGLFFASYCTYFFGFRAKKLDNLARADIIEFLGKQEYFHAWEIGEGDGEGARVRNGNLVMHLPDAGFKYVEDGYFVRYIDVPEYDLSYFTSSIRFSEVPLESFDVASLPRPSSFRSLYSEEYLNRGYKLFQELNITTQRELVDYYLNFDYQSVTEKSSKNEIALALYTAQCRPDALDFHKLYPLSGQFSGYVLFKQSYEEILLNPEQASQGKGNWIIYQEKREWIICIENSRNADTVYKIQIKNEEPVFSPKSRWICTDYTVKDILSKVQIL